MNRRSFNKILAVSPMAAAFTITAPTEVSFWVTMSQPHSYFYEIYGIDENAKRVTKTVYVSAQERVELGDKSITEKYFPGIHATGFGGLF